MWQKAILIALFVLEALSKIYLINRPREQITQTDGVLIVVINAALVLLVLSM